MKKVRTYQRKDRPGWYISWRENGKERKRAFPSKHLAEHYARIKYTELNSETLRIMVDLPWAELKAEYLRTYDVRQLEKSSKYQATNTLRLFEAVNGPVGSQNISQGVIDVFILERAKDVGEWTLNKDISNIRAFLRWGQKRRYISRDLEVEKVKATPRIVVSLKDAQVKNLLISARQRSEIWYVRVLLAITTGLRAEDIENIQVGDIDIENHSLISRSKKTRRIMETRPLHSSLIPILTRYVGELPDGQTKLLDRDTNTWKKWKKIRTRAGLPDLRFRDLRSVFSTALQAQDVPLSVVQNLLEHSSRIDTEALHERQSLTGPRRRTVADWTLARLRGWHNRSL